ncbi:MAG: ABC transporter ATP-binding protein [Myxococcales bacterium]|nr:ABC transporter ATP-binding protein [Myxococcales bacterium]
MIRLTKINKTYDLGAEKLRVLRDVDLTVEDGEMVAVIGPSGSGKSTLMNVIGCLDRPTSGEYWLDGKNIAKIGTNALAEIRNLKIGFVFQSFNLLPRSTALENVELPLVYSGLLRTKKRAEEALDRVGLSDRMKHLPTQLSGGQKQRVAIARALVMNPTIILADEPTGNLDTATGYEIMDLFRALHKTGSTLMMVTHEPDIAEQTERIITIRDGVIESDVANTPVMPEKPQPKVYGEAS